MPRFSKRYQDFDIEYKSVLAYITANQATLGISVEQVTEYTTKGGIWTTSYTAYSDANTRTEAIIAETSRQYQIMRHETNLLQQQIKHNASVTLTEDARINLYIHLDKTTRTPAPRPEIAPAILLVDSGRLINKISATFPTTEAENHRGLPTDVTAIARWTAVSETSEAPARELFTSIDDTGHTVSTIHWQLADANKFGWIICAYRNSRGELGPESGVLMVSIVSPQGA